MFATGPVFDLIYYCTANSPVSATPQKELKLIT